MRPFGLSAPLHVLLLVATFTLAACLPSRVLVAADGPQPWITTDSTRYVLRVIPQQNPANGWEGNAYRLTVLATYTNRSAHTRYLHHQCGTWEGRLSREVVRAGGEGPPAELMMLVGCDWTGEAQRPIPVAPGESYVDRVEMETHDQPMARPRITMANRLGWFRLVYLVRQTGSLTKEWPTDLVPAEERMSTAFEVVLAAPR